MARPKSQTRLKDLPASAGPRDRGFFLAIAIVLLGLAAYHNSFTGVFLYDDIRWITEGERIRYDLWPLGPFLDGSTLRPTLFYSLAINYKLGGLSVAGYHLWNLTVHLIAALALLGIARRTLRLPQFPEPYRAASDGLAFAMAAIWVVHPLQTQAVTYVVQRSESMMGMFLLVGLYGVLRGASSRPAWPWYGLTVLSVTLGMGCKEVMIVALPLILLYDRVFLSSSWRQVVRARWGLYLALLPAWLWLAWGVAPGIRGSIAAGPAVVEAEWPAAAGAQPEGDPPAAVWQPQYRQYTPWQYARTQAEVILHYLRLVFWPRPLCLSYDPWPVPSVQAALLPGLIVLSLLGAGLVALKRAPAIGFLVIAFFLVLAPTSSFLPIRHVAFEHRMYISSAAVIALAVLAACAVQLSWGRRTGRNARATAKIATGVLLVILLTALVTGTISRNRDYQDPQRMWASVVAVRPNNVGALNNLAQALYAQGQTQAALDMLQRGEQIEPHHPAIQASLAEILVAEGEKRQQAGQEAAARALFREAVRRCERALVVWPREASVQFNTGVAYEKLGSWDQAAHHYRQAIQLRPRDVIAHLNLGAVLSHSGQTEEALATYRRGLVIDPEHVDLLSNLGVALAQAGRFDEAAQQLQKATRLAPQALHLWENLTLVYADAGQYAAAVHTGQQAAGVARQLGQYARAQQIEAKIKEYASRLPAPGKATP